jgi:hypothetical protein
MGEKTPIEIEMFWRRPKLSPEDEHLVNLGRLKRPPSPTLTLYFDGHLSEWPEHGCRFAITGTGRVLTGDPHRVLHEDMVRGSCLVGEGERFLAGCIVPYRRAWTMYAVQNFAVQARSPGKGPSPAEVLCSRLSTWAEFTRGERIFWPHDGEFSVEFEERIFRDNPDMASNPLGKDGAK